MPARPFRSVRARILASMLAVAAAGMLVAGGTAYLIQRERTLAQVDERLAAVVSDASVVATEAQATTLEEALTAIVQRIRPASGEATFALVDGSTALVPGGDQARHPERDAALVARITEETADAGVVRGTATSEGTPLRYVAIPVTVAGQSASGVFVVTVDLEAELAPIDQAFETFALVALIALVVLGLVGWFVAGRLLSPIRKLRDTAARITGSDVSERIDVVGTDDVSDLTVTVNEMLDRLQGALTGQRQLLDDVGHELKTPITIVRGHLELMSPSDPSEVAATRELAIDELDRMSGLVRDISELATVGRPLALHLEATDIAALTESARLKAVALSSEHRWTNSEVARVTARVDPERITQAMLQLCANAVTHGSPRGRVDISSAVHAGRLVFSVTDDGPGVDEASRALVFERFRRGTEGRGTGGSGLGLAIVDAIARAHGGAARVESRPGTGATFVIDIPLEVVGTPEETP